MSLINGSVRVQASSVPYHIKRRPRVALECMMSSLANKFHYSRVRPEVVVVGRTRSLEDLLLPVAVPVLYLPVRTVGHRA